MSYYNEINYTTQISIDGTSIKDYVETIQADFSEEDFVNQITIKFNNAAKSIFATLCNPNVNFGQERIALTITRPATSATVTYNFLLEKRDTSVRSTTVSFAVWGRSKAALLGLPFTGPFIQTSEAVLDIEGSTYGASEIIQKVIQYSGVSITASYQLGSNFQVPAGSFVVSNKTPMEIIDGLANVLGGRVRSDKYGNLIIDTKYFSTEFVTPVLTFTEIENIIQLDESIVYSEGINRVKIIGHESSEESSRSIKLVLDPDEHEDTTCIVPGEKFYIRVYTSPFNMPYYFNTTIGAFYHVGQYAGRHVEQNVLIVKGVGNLSYPVASIDSYTWHGTNLGTLQFTSGFSNIATSEESAYGVLSSISYSSTYDKYECIVSDAGTALYFAMELSGE